MSARSILTLGWTVFIVCAYPGVLDEVAFEHLREGRSWELSDRHSAAMSALWGLAEHIISGPFVLLVIQSTLVLIGTYSVLRRALAERHAAVAACVLLLFPPVLATTMTIRSDTMMTGCLLVAAGTLCDERRRSQLWGLVWCGLAVAFRLEAILAVPPIVLLLFAWDQRRVHRYAVAFGAWIAVGVFGVVVDAALTDVSVPGEFAFAPGEADMGAELPVHTHSPHQFAALKEVGLAGGSSRFQNRVGSALRLAARDTPLFRPFLFVLVALALFPFCRGRPDLIALLGSGAAFGIVVLPGTPSLYSVLTACIGIVILIARRWRQG